MENTSSIDIECRRLCGRKAADIFHELWTFAHWYFGWWWESEREWRFPLFFVALKASSLIKDFTLYSFRWEKSFIFQRLEEIRELHVTKGKNRTSQYRWERRKSVCEDDKINWTEISLKWYQQGREIFGLIFFPALKMMFSDELLIRRIVEENLSLFRMTQHEEDVDDSHHNLYDAFWCYQEICLISFSLLCLVELERMWFSSFFRCEHKMRNSSSFMVYDREKNIYYSIDFADNNKNRFSTDIKKLSLSLSLFSLFLDSVQIQKSSLSLWFLFSIHRIIRGEMPESFSHAHSIFLLGIFRMESFSSIFLCFSRKSFAQYKRLIRGSRAKKNKKYKRESSDF